MIKQKYDVYVNSPALGIFHAADCVISEDRGHHQGFAFRYRPDYIDHPQAFALDPVHLPLGPRVIEVDRPRGSPGILDDYLPDDWGRKVMIQVAEYQRREHYNSHSLIDSLSLVSKNRIGSICIVKKGETPSYELGEPTEILQEIEKTALMLDEGNIRSLGFEQAGLVYLMNSGSGVGGARPKALLVDGKIQQPYIAKFNRISRDSYNNARVEHACLEMARQAGIVAPTAKLHPGISGRETLLVSRFDVDDNLGCRHHMTSALT